MSSGFTPRTGEAGSFTAQLRRIPEVIAIAYGQEKVSAARAALGGGYIDALVTHTAFAEHLLQQ
jgi:DNA-binding transcriptional regulator LsrR (DeoR family)